MKRKNLKIAVATVVAASTIIIFNNFSLVSTTQGKRLSKNPRGSKIAPADEASRMPASLKTGLPASCSGPAPTPNPNKTFLQNFMNTNYAIMAPTGSGTTGGGAGDALYNSLYYKINNYPNPGYDILLFASFPNARYFSIASGDDHYLNGSSLLDQNIIPLASIFKNPYKIGSSYLANQQFGVDYTLGQHMTNTPQPGCALTGLTLNNVDATVRHPLVTWPNGTAGVQDHNEGPSFGGNILLRRYIEEGGDSFNPIFFVRNLTTGCAIPVCELTQMGIIPTDTNSVFDTNQINAHWAYQDTISDTCYQSDPNNGFLWFRGDAYVPNPNPDGAYVTAVMDSGVLTPILTNPKNNNFLQFQFQLANTPNTPCPQGQSCALTGTEQLRYWGMTFEGTSGAVQTTLGYVDDRTINRDPGGFANLIFGFGATPPAQVLNPSSGYTYIDMSKIKNFTSLTSFTIRTMLPGNGFACSGSSVPNSTLEYNQLGGFMGAYIPTVTLVTGASLPAVAVDLVKSNNSCGVMPPPSDIMSCP